MKRTFLGKRIPQHGKPNPSRRARPAWFGLMILPALLAGGLLSLQHSQLTPETGPRDNGNALARTVAAANGHTLADAQGEQLAVGGVGSSGAAGAAAGAAAGTTGGTGNVPAGSAGAAASTVVPNPCIVTLTLKTDSGKSVTINEISEAFRRELKSDGTIKDTISDDITLFPIIPDGLRGVNRSGVDVTKDKDPAVAASWCSQPFWTIAVAYWFIYKTLAFLNWAAVAIAILLSLYAGVLYITGFAKEDNVKKAKTILIGAYAGLAIVFLAKVLVFGAVNVISGVDPTKVPPPVNLESQ